MLLSPQTLTSTRIPTGSQEKKGASISVKMVKASEKESLFGMCQFCFLSEASWETVTFALIDLIFSYYSLFYFPI